MTDSIDYLGLSVASVATILVDGLDGDAVTGLLDAQGLPYDRQGDLVGTTLVRQDDAGDPVEVLVDFDLADGVLHVHSREYLDAYGLAPVAGDVVAALSGAESQSLFTYSVTFEHPLVDFPTLVEYLEGATYRDPSAEGDSRSDDRPGRDGTGRSDRDARGIAPGEDGSGPAGSRPEPPAPATAADRPHLLVAVEGDRFELYEDGYLLPVDDAGGAAVERFLRTVDARLRDAFPDPPESLSAAELPDGWAGPLVAAHPEAGAVAERWADRGELDGSGGGTDAVPGGSALAGTLLDTAAALVYAVDRCSPELRRQYYERYADADGSPLRVPIVAATDGDGGADADRFAERELWSTGLRRAIATAHREVRSLGDVADSYGEVSLGPGQVWRHHGRDAHRIETVEVTGREFVGEQFVSLPVWVGKIRAVEPCDHDPGGTEREDGTTQDGDDGTHVGDEDHGDDVEPGDTVVIDGNNLLELVEDAD